MKMTYRSFILVSFMLLYIQGIKAQFEPLVHEGDFMPVKTEPKAERQNPSLKDPSQIYFDSHSKLWHATWTQFDAHQHIKASDHSHIFYAQSTEGKAWNAPIQLNTLEGDCRDEDSTLKGPMPCVGARGEIYVCWAGPKGLAFQRSLDSGKTWLKEEKTLITIHKGWSCKVDGIQTNGLPVIACDLSGGEFRGRVYICWSDEKNGEKNKDVFLIYSDDQGEHWTEPILISYRPNHKEQFKPCLKVDSLSGFVYILYFDKQNYFEGKQTDLSIAISKNGGLKFDYFKVNNQSFSFQSNFTELHSQNGITARWVQDDAAKKYHLYEVVVNDSTISGYYMNELGKDMEMERSFLYKEKMALDFQISAGGMITAVITKPLEPGMEKVICLNKKINAGKNTLELDFKSLGLEKGTYTLTLYYHGRNSFVWITSE